MQAADQSWVTTFLVIPEEFLLTQTTKRSRHSKNSLRKSLPPTYRKRDNNSNPSYISFSNINTKKWPKHRRGKKVPGQQGVHMQRVTSCIRKALGFRLQLQRLNGRGRPSIEGPPQAPSSGSTNHREKADSAVKTIPRHRGTGGQPGNWPGPVEWSFFCLSWRMDRNSLFCPSDTQAPKCLNPAAV